MKLYLVRHANALESPLGDYERKLSEKGNVECVDLRSFILSKKITSKNKVLCSAAQRTKETYSNIFTTPEGVSFHKRLYLANAMDLLDFICSIDSDEDIVLIGHNNGLSQLASYLTAKHIVMRTASCVEIRFPFDHSKLISKGTGEIYSHHRCDIMDSYYF